MVRYARHGVADEAVVCCAHERGVAGAGWRIEKPARAWLDLMPLDLIEPAILIGTGTHWKNEGIWHGAIFVALGSCAERLDQLHIRLDLGLLACWRCTERHRNARQDIAAAVGARGDPLLCRGRAALPGDRAVVAPAQLPP